MTLSRCLDFMAHPKVMIHRRSWSSFHVCGSVGWVAGISFALLLTVRLGLSLGVTAVLAVAAFITFLTLTMAVKVLTGVENIVYYHHEAAVVAVSSLLLRLLHQPVLPYLDIVFMGLGLFLVCGRVGCLMVGCCHGRPHPWGVCYRQEHADAGFPRHLVGIRLFPIQLLEALFVGFIVTTGTVLVLTGAPPGSALAWYSIAYGLGRFSLELLRGDPERPYFGSFSEAQWTTLALMSITTAAELAGLLPLSWWHVAATAGLAGAMIILATAEDPTRRLFRPRHVQELAALLEAARSRSAAAGEIHPGEIHLGETSLGVRISASRVREAEREIDVVAFSCRGRALSEPAAGRLARLIRRLQHVDAPAAPADLVKGNGGVYHLLLPAKRSAYAV